jgi:GTP-binding protein
MGSCRKRNQHGRDYEKELKKRLAPFSDVPVVFTSVHRENAHF